MHDLRLAVRAVWASGVRLTRWLLVLAAASPFSSEAGRQIAARPQGIIDCCAGIDVGPTVEEQSDGCNVAVFRSHMQKRSSLQQKGTSAGLAAIEFRETRNLKGGLLPFPRTWCVLYANTILSCFEICAFLA